METMDDVLAVIPARGGSRRLPDKNMKLLAGKPLLGWTVDHAKAAGIPAARIVVSSDYQPALDYARSQGVVALRRPEELSQGQTPPVWNARHALKALRESVPGVLVGSIVYLQPTSPFRSADDIRSALRVLHNTGADAVVTIRKPKEELYHLGHAGRIRLLSYTELGSVFTPNGAVYAITAAHLDAGGDWWDGITEGHLMPDDRSLDIDTHHDFEAAEKIAAALALAGPV
jgi:CMP-N,N'-diacetyllegionaminic acid synthase